MVHPSFLGQVGWAHNVALGLCWSSSRNGLDDSPLPPPPLPPESAVRSQLKPLPVQDHGSPPSLPYGLELHNCRKGGFIWELGADLRGGWGAESSESLPELLQHMVLGLEQNWDRGGTLCWIISLPTPKASTEFPAEAALLMLVLGSSPWDRTGSHALTQEGALAKNSALVWREGCRIRQDRVPLPIPVSSKPWDRALEWIWEEL